MLTVSRKAEDRIGPVLERYGELLPLACEDGEFWTLNVTCLLDALDLERSDVLRASDTGTVLMVRKHVFRAEKLHGAGLFKVPETELSGLIYFTSSIIDEISVFGLAGLGFKCVWVENG